MDAYVSDHGWNNSARWRSNSSTAPPTSQPRGTPSRSTDGRRRLTSWSRADREGRLGATDLEALAQAAWFTAQPDLAVEAKERAFKAYVARGNKSPGRHDRLRAQPRIRQQAEVLDRLGMGGSRRAPLGG